MYGAGGGASQKAKIYIKYIITTSFIWWQWHCCIEKECWSWSRVKISWLSCFSVPDWERRSKGTLAYLGSSHQEIIHWPGRGDSLFTQGSSVSFTNSSHYLSHLSLVRFETVWHPQMCRPQSKMCRNLLGKKRLRGAFSRPFFFFKLIVAYAQFVTLLLQSNKPFKVINKENKK